MFMADVLVQSLEIKLFLPLPVRRKQNKQKQQNIKF